MNRGSPNIPKITFEESRELRRHPRHTDQVRPAGRRRSCSHGCATAGEWWPRPGLSTGATVSSTAILPEARMSSRSRR